MEKVIPTSRPLIVTTTAEFIGQSDANIDCISPSGSSGQLAKALASISRIHDAYCADDAERLDREILDAMDIVDNE